MPHFILCLGSEATAEDLRQLVQRAERGDESALPELRRLLDREPGLWHFAGDLSRIAEAAMISVAAGNNLLLKESLAACIGRVPRDGRRDSRG